MHGLAGADKLYGHEYEDSMYGGPGNDKIHGQNGPDVILGGVTGSSRNEDDHLYGGFGKDGLYGLHGNDALTGGPGRDILAGGAGDDTIDAVDGERDKEIVCQSGTDTVYFDRGLDTDIGSCERRRPR